MWVGKGGRSGITRDGANRQNPSRVCWDFVCSLKISEDILAEKTRFRSIQYGVLMPRKQKLSLVLQEKINISRCA